ncbi:5264_t:CDS:2 [Funneliformis mosseae]|uniref:5264_t:CDS:1 n=1 Tax=Funneliformis mosseae TaxID=27381 RepID=A0A9N9CN57_FUNMO|nr:5264_t:CDS:2 [Funneliformis mosseae]
MSRLPADCLNDIFEYLEDDKSTLVACLPNESKIFLHTNKIFIATPTSNPPLFNYVSFCKVISIHGINQMVKLVSKYNNYLISQEILKMFMNKITCLQELKYYSDHDSISRNIKFTKFPGATLCLKNLSKLNCSSDLHSEFFSQLSQLCCNLQSLTIEFEESVTKELKDLISSQRNLEYLTLIQSEDLTDITDIIPSLIKHSNTLTKLKIIGGTSIFISAFSNIQELILSHLYSQYLGNPFEDFKELQFVKFPQLQILKLQLIYRLPNYENLINFLENNGKNLKVLYIDDSDYSLNLSIAKFCPKLESLFNIILVNEIGSLKLILMSCKLLKSIKVWCGEDDYLNERELLDTVVKCSPNNFYELKIYYINNVRTELHPEELEEFLIGWTNRIPQKSLSLILITGYCTNSLNTKKENMEVIEKYKKSGVIKSFEVVNFDDESDFCLP